nr:chloride channel protein [Catenulispora pinistramenti]
MLLFAALGVLAGAVGVAFSKILYWIQDLCDWAWRWPEWARPAVGGLLLGGLLLLLPEMYGVGYPVLGNAVAGRYAIGFLVLLLVGKIVATSLTIGIGDSGGVFAPSLFLGAMLGSAFGILAHDVFGVAAGGVGSYALPASLPATTSLSQAADTLAASRHGALPVTVADGSFLGVACAREVAEVLAEGGRDGEEIGHVAHVPHALRADAELSAALDALVSADPWGLPVLDAAGTRLSGWITHQAVLAAAHRRPIAASAPS